MVQYHHSLKLWEGARMQPVFDLKKLEMILKDFYELSHIRITVFDAQFHELLTYPQGHCAVCALIRADAR